jgi:hypothetical protein
MNYLEEIKKWLGEITEIFLLLTTLGIVVGLITNVDVLQFLVDVLPGVLSLAGLCISYFLGREFITLKGDERAPIAKAIRNLWSSDKETLRSNKIQLAASVVYLSTLRRSMTWVYGVLLASVPLFPCGALITGSTTSSSLLLFPLVILILLVFREILIRYRIEAGHFGLNPVEARELINFIISNADKIDFRDSSGKTIEPLVSIQTEKETGLTISSEGATT